MSLSSKTINYSDENRQFQAYMAWEQSEKTITPRPAVLIAPTVRGLSEFEKGVANKLAENGWIAIAIDMYGDSRQQRTMEEDFALMQSLLDDRDELLNRISLATTMCKEQPEVDASKLAAIGFCFGGLCVLDLARSGADLLGVVSFHGLFTPTGNKNADKIIPSVLVLHGYDDPSAPPDAMIALATELSEGDADWQIHAYGKTMHAFTNPEANFPERGAVYNELARNRSFETALAFLTERFAHSASG